MLNDRQNQLFLHLIWEHVATGLPVGSKLLAEKAGLDRSSATIRNEFSVLEHEKLIHQPYTSAGRIPTEKGWRYYLDHLMKEKPVTEKEKKALQKAISVHQTSGNEGLKAMAKTLADLSDAAAVVAFSPHDVYYTGLSNLFNQPEFNEANLMRDMTAIIDHLDDVMQSLFGRVENGTHILVGGDNPFGENCAVVITKLKQGSDERLCGILGPMRMAYDANLGLINYARTLLA